jgi:hypothetical protein
MLKLHIIQFIYKKLELIKVYLNSNKLLVDFAVVFQLMFKEMPGAGVEELLDLKT